MLTDEEKKRINAEEVFRKEVQDSLKKEKEGKIWQFLNSSFGIWLLSSVVLGLVTFSYQQYEDTSTETKQEKKEIAALDAEIGGRLRYLNTQAASIKTCGDYASFIGSIIENANYSQEVYSVTKDFEGQSFRALLTRLRALVATDRDRKDEVKRALDGLDEIQQNARQPMSDCPTRGSLQNPMTSAQTSSLDIIKSALSRNFSSAHWE